MCTSILFSQREKLIKMELQMTENIFSDGNKIRWNNNDPTLDMYVTVLPYKDTDDESLG